MLLQLYWTPCDASSAQKEQAGLSRKTKKRSFAFHGQALPDRCLSSFTIHPL
jgi:hypothetical protein